jgi:hypothetical protein
MRVVLFADNTVPVALAPLCAALTRTGRGISFFAGESPVHLEAARISCPGTYRSLPDGLLAEAARYDLAILCTVIPYENNYFFQGDGNLVILSFAGWHLLTRLPMSNGIAYFAASVIADMAGLGSSHDENTGCVNDFWWDKRGVDVGMRAAYVCPQCAESFAGDARSLEGVRGLLDLVSTASRQGKDILTVAPDAAAPPGFDVFMCHNGQDKPAVREINAALKEQGIRTWLDEEQLPLGTPWQPELEARVGDVRAACVCVGNSGLGPWQDMEIRAFLSEFVRRERPVIPVLLPDAPAVPDLPLFLRQMTWLDLRQERDKGMKRLAEALKNPRG